ncbi:valine--tRNA ligase, partial [Linderina pennispora]
CGTDALRFTLCAYTSAGRDVNLNVLRVDGYRKFCNKLWNATRFALMKLGDDFKPRAEVGLGGAESLAERWILHKLNIAARDVNAGLAEMNFMAATTAVYSFWLYDLCDVYIEYIKPITTPEADADARHSAQETLYTCLEQGLKLLHPFMPFVTEELWQRLPRRASETSRTICLAEFPEPHAEYESPQAERDFDLVMSIVKAGRSLVTDYHVTSKATIYIAPATAAAHALATSEAPGICTLIKGCSEVIALQPAEA